MNNKIQPFYTKNLESDTIQNENYRKVIYTGKNQQLVLMSLKPNDFIHMETHEIQDQFIRVESGIGKAMIGDNTFELEDGSCVIIPAGFSHKIINLSSINPLKLYTIYSPPEHPDGLIQQFNPDANNEIKVKMRINEETSDSNKQTYKLKYLKYKNKYIKLKKYNIE